MAPRQLVEVQQGSSHATAADALAVRGTLHILRRHLRLEARFANLLLRIKLRSMWVVPAHSVLRRRDHLLGRVVRLHPMAETQVDILQQLLLVALDEAPQVGVLRQRVEVLINLSRFRRGLLCLV